MRTLIDPKAPQARYVGLLNTGGYARGLDVEGPPGTLHFVFGKRCFFGYVRSPTGEVWWFANPGRNKEPTRAELAAITADQWRTELLELFKSDATPAADIVRATPTILRGWSTYDFPTVPRWRLGRMIIIGDAAHATSPASGQGASMALEDAVVLARCLRDVSGIEAALAVYEALRRERVERVVAMGKRNGDGKAPSPQRRLASPASNQALGAPLADRPDGGVTLRPAWKPAGQVNRTFDRKGGGPNFIRGTHAKNHAENRDWCGCARDGGRARGRLGAPVRSRTLLVEVRGRRPGRGADH